MAEWRLIPVPAAPRPPAHADASKRRQRPSVAGLAARRTPSTATAILRGRTYARAWTDSRTTAFRARPRASPPPIALRRCKAIRATMFARSRAKPPRTVEERHAPPLTAFRATACPVCASCEQRFCSCRVVRPSSRAVGVRRRMGLWRPDSGRRPWRERGCRRRRLRIGGRKWQLVEWIWFRRFRER